MKIFLGIVLWFVIFIVSMMGVMLWGDMTVWGRVGYWTSALIFSFVGLLAYSVYSLQHDFRIAWAHVQNGEFQIGEKKLLALRDRLPKSSPFIPNVDLALAGLMGYVGRWQGADQLHQSIDPDKYPKTFNKGNMVVYANNILWHAVLTGRYDEARRLYELHKGRLEAPQKRRDVADAIRSTLACYAYSQGNYNYARSELEALIKTDLTATKRAANNFFLGLIAHQQGDMERRAFHFGEARRFGPQTCFYDMTLQIENRQGQEA